MCFCLCRKMLSWTWWFIKWLVIISVVLYVLACITLKLYEWRTGKTIDRAAAERWKHDHQHAARPWLKEAAHSVVHHIDTKIDSALDSSSSSAAAAKKHSHKRDGGSGGDDDDNIKRHGTPAPHVDVKRRKK
jgi:hypothetical protein